MKTIHFQAKPNTGNEPNVPGLSFSVDITAKGPTKITLSQKWEVSAAKYFYVLDGTTKKKM